MNKLSALALGTALAFAAPLAAHAQDTGVGVELGGEGGIGLDINLDAFTHADVDTAIQSSGSVTLDDVDATTDIEIVAISTLSANDGGDASILADTRAAFDADITALKDRVSANAELVAALEAQGYTADDVVAVWSQANGALTVFVDA